MNRLTLYLTKHYLLALLISFLIIMGIITLIDFVETARNFDNNEAVVATTLLYLTSLKFLSLLEKALPFIVFFATMGALFTLNRRAELIVIRACGLSVWAFLTPLFVIIIIMGGAWSLYFNPLSLTNIAKYKNFEQTQSLLAQTSAQKNQSAPVWIKEEYINRHTIIHARSIALERQALYDVQFYDFKQINKRKNTTKPILQARHDAKIARLLPNNKWLLSDVTSYVIAQKSQTQHHLILPTKLGLEDLQNLAKQAGIPSKQFSFWQLPAVISERESLGFSAHTLRLTFYNLLVLPLSLISMCMIASTCSLGFIRQGGYVPIMLMGGSVGFCLYFTREMVNALGRNASLPAWLAASSIPTIMLCIGLYILSHQEDG